MVKPETENKYLIQVKKLLVEGGIPADNALAYSGPDAEIQILMENIRTDTKGHCYFFFKQEKDMTFLIALVKIKNIGEIFEKIKEKIKFNKVNSSVTHQSNFNPKGITFGK